MSDLLTVDEAAEYLRVSVSGLHKLRREAGLPYVKLGNRVLFKRDALNNYVDQRMINATQEVENNG